MRNRIPQFITCVCWKSEQVSQLLSALALGGHHLLSWYCAGVDRMAGTSECGIRSLR
jgi:hypothetical protein